MTDREMGKINTLSLLRRALRGSPGHLLWFNQRIYMFRVRRRRISICKAAIWFLHVGERGEEKKASCRFTASLLQPRPAAHLRMNERLRSRFLRFHFAGDLWSSETGPVEINCVFVFNRVMDAPTRRLG